MDVQLQLYTSLRMVSLRVQAEPSWLAAEDAIVSRLGTLRLATEVRNRRAISTLHVALHVAASGASWAVMARFTRS